MIPHIPFSIPQAKIWRRHPFTYPQIGDTVWFMVSSSNGIEQECLTGTFAGSIILRVGRFEYTEVMTVVVGMEDWLVDPSRVFLDEYTATVEASTYSEWCRELRRFE